MAFDKELLGLTSSNLNLDSGGAMFTYKAADDQATVEASNYFADAKERMRDGSFLTIYYFVSTNFFSATQYIVTITNSGNIQIKPNFNPTTFGVVTTGPFDTVAGPTVKVDSFEFGPFPNNGTAQFPVPLFPDIDAGKPFTLFAVAKAQTPSDDSVAVCMPLSWTDGVNRIDFKLRLDGGSQAEIITNFDASDYSGFVTIIATD